MKAFHGRQDIKERYLTRVRWHREMDHLTQGVGWEVNGETRGCAIGCTLESYNHSRYPIELGLPEWLAHLEDTIFEGLPREDALAWPERFLSAIPVGANLEPVRHQLAIRRMDRLIEQQTAALESATDEYGVKAAVAQVIDALRVVRACHESELDGDSGDAESAAESAAESEARSAAWSAEAEARSAAEAAESAARSVTWSAWSAWSAARSVAWSAEAEARSAESAARSEAEAAWSVAESAARSVAVYKREADDLIELLEALEPEKPHD